MICLSDSHYFDLSSFENSLFRIIPQEVVLQIFKNLTYQDIQLVRLVCRNWKWLTDQAELFVPILMKIKSNSEIIGQQLNSINIPIDLQVNQDQIALLIEKGLSTTYLETYSIKHKSFRSKHHSAHFILQMRDNQEIITVGIPSASSPTLQLVKQDLSAGICLESLLPHYLYPIFSRPNNRREYAFTSRDQPAEIRIFTLNSSGSCRLSVVKKISITPSLTGETIVQHVLLGNSWVGLIVKSKRTKHYSLKLFDIKTGYFLYQKELTQGAIGNQIFYDSFCYNQDYIAYLDPMTGFPQLVEAFSGKCIWNLYFAINQEEQKEIQESKPYEWRFKFDENLLGINYAKSYPTKHSLLYILNVKTKQFRRIHRERFIQTSLLKQQHVFNETFADICLTNKFIAIASKIHNHIEIWNIEQDYLITLFKTKDKPIKLYFDDQMLIAILSNGQSQLWYDPSHK